MKSLKLGFFLGLTPRPNPICSFVIFAVNVTHDPVIVLLSVIITLDTFRKYMNCTR